MFIGMATILKGNILYPIGTYRFYATTIYIERTDMIGDHEQGTFGVYESCHYGGGVELPCGWHYENYYILLDDWYLDDVL